MMANGQSDCFMISRGKEETIAPDNINNESFEDTELTNGLPVNKKRLQLSRLVFLILMKLTVFIL